MFPDEIIMPLCLEKNAMVKKQRTLSSLGQEQSPKSVRFKIYFTHQSKVMLPAWDFS